MDMLLPIITPVYKGSLIGLFLGAFASLALLVLRMVMKERGRNERCHGVMKIRGTKSRINVGTRRLRTYP